MRIPTEKELGALRRKLILWFDKNGRTLPWRYLNSESKKSLLLNSSSLNTASLDFSLLDLSSNNKDSIDDKWYSNIKAYRVWVSEIMLQQTTTKTVEGYFDRFMTVFPTIQALAEADIADVLHLWEGLGYYRRAHQLHRAAQIIWNEKRGIFPTSIQEVLTLPGIGRYTAGAILSIAFNQRVPILEANTIRLHSRLIGLEGDPSRSEESKVLWNFAETILPKKDCGKFNQILMDLGSLVCLPENPLCIECPARNSCEAARICQQSFIPHLKKKTEKEYRREVAFLVHCPNTDLVANNIQTDMETESQTSGNNVNGKTRDNCKTIDIGKQSKVTKSTIYNKAYSKTENFQEDEKTQSKVKCKRSGKGSDLDRFLLIRYPEGGRWTGLWDFPRFLCDSDKEIRNNTVLQNELVLLLNNEGNPLLKTLPLLGSLLKTIHHSVTKYKITLDFYDTEWGVAPLLTDANASWILGRDKIDFASGSYLLSEVEKRWVTLQEAEFLPLSSTGRKLVQGLL